MAFNLLDEVTVLVEELGLLEEILQEKKLTLKKEASSTDRKLEQLVDLQAQMQEQIIHFQRLQIRETEQRNRNQAETTLKLPKLDLVNNGGDKLKWTEFWDAFEIAVHNNHRLANIDKFNYLKTKLYGSAKAAISGLALSNDNYEVAVKILKERFGESQLVVNKHYADLINLSPASNQISSLRKMYDDMENHLRSLEALKQDTNQEVFISMITSKLPREVLIQLEIQKGNKEKWTVTKLRQSLNTYVMAREAAEYQSRTRDRCDDRPKTSYQQNRHIHNSQSRQHSSAEALVASSQAPRRSICRYCNGKHWSDECQKVKTIEDRKKSINGSCYICLKPGHLSRDCRIEKACYYCKRTKSHHRSLCPKKFNSSNKEISHLVSPQRTAQQRL